MRMSRLASKASAASWKPRPGQEKCSSPVVVKAMLAVRIRMLMRAVLEGVDTAQSQLVRRVITGPVAFFLLVYIEQSLDREKITDEEKERERDTFNICENGTLRYRYTILLQIKLPLFSTAMGPNVRKSNPGVNLRFFRPSSRVVVRARTCVASVAKMRCHVGRMTAWFVRDYSLMSVGELTEFCILLVGCIWMDAIMVLTELGRLDNPFVEEDGDVRPEYP